MSAQFELWRAVEFPPHTNREIPVLAMFHTMCIYIYIFYVFFVLFLHVLTSFSHQVDVRAPQRVNTSSLALPPGQLLRYCLVELLFTFMIIAKRSKAETCCEEKSYIKSLSFFILEPRNHFQQHHICGGALYFVHLLRWLTHNFVRECAACAHVHYTFSEPCHWKHVKNHVQSPFAKRKWYKTISIGSIIFKLVQRIEIKLIAFIL